MQNKLRYLLFSIFLVILTTESYSSTILKGKAPSYSGETLYFHTYPDLITKRPKEIGSCPVNDKGEFNFEFDNNSTVQVYVELGRVAGYLYAEPGKIYELILPPRQAKTMNDRLNPYFQPQIIHLGVTNQGSDDLNVLIQKFDQIFNPFINDYALQKYFRKEKEADRFRYVIDSLFSGYNEVYLQQYIMYRLSLLDYIKYSGGKQSDFYSKFPGTKVGYDNPGFVDLFNRVFARFLYQYSKTPEGSKVNEIIFRSPGSLQIRQSIKNAGLFKTDSLIELVILKGIYDELFESDYPEVNLLTILDSIHKESAIQRDREIIENIVWKATRLEVGSQAPEFKLFNQENLITSLDDFKGKYVYLNFVSFQSYACQVQFPILSDLVTNFKDSLVVVSISIDESPLEIKNQVKNKNYSWPFLHIGNDLDLLINYDIRAYPTYFLLNKEGKFISSPAPSPIDNFKDYFSKILLNRN